ncbi:hypothetical protein GYMLUDRAFT_261432 [Collybiopsis luxurians FD-317 M1]|uniref:Uncharacterized protein n=1 Tax=Collybiopsis luxurians FD-317 M1 TaxID=944289 RepID=A0A0D0B9U2_9AGAR|nr:hypothetical protein GYMLUDRAFT_261432 [Collybiopsis luxurians FD-317 M1]
MIKFMFLRRRRSVGAATGPGTYVPTLSFFNAEATSTVDPSSIFEPRELLEQLRVLSLDREITIDGHRRVVMEICDIYEAALAEDEQSIEAAERDGITIQNFLPMMTSILWSTIQYARARAPASNSGRSDLLSRRKADSLKKLKSLRNQLRAIYFIAMPYVSPQVSHRGENALVIAANVGGVLTALCDGVPILGMLKPAAGMLGGVCRTMQTLRSNDDLASEILQVVRDDFRMIVRKIQRHPSTQADSELRKDIDEYFCTLQDIILQSLGKINRTGKRSTSNRFRLVAFAQKDSDDLRLLQQRVQEARSAFQVKLALSTAISISTIIQQTIFHNTAEQGPAQTRALENSPTSFPVVQPRRQVCNSGALEDALPAEPSAVLSKQFSGINFNEAPNLHLLLYMVVYFFFSRTHQDHDPS